VIPIRALVVGGTTLLVAGACADTPGSGTEGSSAFALDTPVVGSVVENSTACEVDAICSLRVAFSDTTVVVIYGTGEREPVCTTPSEASNAAFGAEAGGRVELVVEACGSDGLHLQAYRPVPPGL
jgi:hypothetical protein